MNDRYIQEAVRSVAKKKFRGRKKLRSKVQPHFPNSSVREYKRFTIEYTKITKQVMSKYLPKIIEAINAQDEPLRHDDARDINNLIDEVFFDVKVDLKRKFGLFNLEKKLNKLAGAAKNSSIAEWKRTCKQTLGIDIFEDYYKGEFYRTKLEEWVNKNVQLIKAQNDLSLDKMHTIVKNGFRSGKSTKGIIKDIQEEYGFTESRCSLVARDQMAKLNADLTKKQQESAGVKTYEWSTSGDSRVRDRHADLDGTVHSWNDPPVVTEPGKPERRCHPGEDYQCRCVAIPIFDYETLDLPMSDADKNISVTIK